MNVDTVKEKIYKTPTVVKQNTRPVVIEETCSNDESKEVKEVGEEPLKGAPNNVTRLFSPTTPWVTTGYRSVFTLPISYTLSIQRTSIFLPSNPTLYNASTCPGPTRFLVVDSAIYSLHSTSITSYFHSYNLTPHIHVMLGEESHKNLSSLTLLIDALSDYGLKRREPFYAIGGGCVLDVCGLAASTYRRGVPFIRVPTTLLSLVDASVGVKNGIDYECCLTESKYKNRLGTFYPPVEVVCWAGFLGSQDRRNLSNGCGEIVKLSLVKSEEIFGLLEEFGTELVGTGFGEEGSEEVKTAAARVIELSIEVMLQELGPNLYEFELERPVDYGHTFSKVVEMVPGADIMHGEAVNVDGFFSAVLSFGRGWIDEATLTRIYKVMKGLGLPVASDLMTEENCLKALEDAVEHRHGKQRIPLLKDRIGNSICVSDITEEEVQRALNFLPRFLEAAEKNL
ncbi:hypothetical protein TrVE_jg3762 [Triparma verrucosa]|uniref:3-dehydroquinate synthase domain-containing protein n=1 Tax=Triparma verrucosa TaxID=1606542 RepID=A0A9W7B2M6_9STRA|nr:hypothetical protein TrVE_jg3762 [Triparma verrucosa]